MPIKKINYTILLDKTTELLRHKGYHAMSIDDVAKACEIKKASVYHYTSGKSALALATLNRKTERFKREVLAFAYQQDTPAATRLKHFIEAMRAYYAVLPQGCLMGNLALEITDETPELDQAIKAFFEAWVAALQHILKAVVGDDRALALAQDSVAQVQGALMLKVVYENDAPLNRVFDHLQVSLLNQADSAA